MHRRASPTPVAAIKTRRSSRVILRRPEVGIRTTASAVNPHGQRTSVEHAPFGGNFHRNSRWEKLGHIQSAAADLLFHPRGNGRSLLQPRDDLRRRQAGFLG